MEIKKFSIPEAEKLFKGPWDPKGVVEFAGHIFRIARFEGRYGETLHTHQYDEFFLVLEGKIRIDTEGKSFDLNTFEGIIIPAGVGHQPFAEKPALVLMLDPNEK